MKHPALVSLLLATALAGCGADGVERAAADTAGAVSGRAGPRPVVAAADMAEALLADAAQHLQAAASDAAPKASGWWGDWPGSEAAAPGAREDAPAAGAQVLAQPSPPAGTASTPSRAAAPAGGRGGTAPLLAGTAPASTSLFGALAAATAAAAAGTERPATSPPAPASAPAPAPAGGPPPAPKAPAPRPPGPTPVLAPAQQAAFDRLNAIRAQAGLPPLAVHAAPAASAQRHARYLSHTDQLGLYETNTGAPDYSGYSPFDRMAVAGLWPVKAGAEIVTRSVGGDPAVAVDGFLGAIHHRFGILRRDLALAGTGVQSKTLNGQPVLDLVVDLGTLATPSLPPAGALTVWPPEGASASPAAFDSDSESPDPLPGANKAGFPVSVQADARQRLAVGAFTLARVTDGARVAARLLSAETDPDTPPHAAAIVPLEPLAPDTRYVASFQGSVDGYPVDRRWQFSTAPVTLAVDRTTAAPGQSIVFTVGGLDPSERYHWCASNGALTGDATFASPTRFALPARSGCPGTNCPVTVSVSYEEGCATALAQATVQITR